MTKLEQAAANYVGRPNGQNFNKLAETLAESYTYTKRKHTGYMVGYRATRGSLNPYDWKTQQPEYDGWREAQLGIIALADEQS